jgi:hypothetical protein
MGFRLTNHLVTVEVWDVAQVRQHDQLVLTPAVA